MMGVWGAPILPFKISCQRQRTAFSLPFCFLACTWFTFFNMMKDVRRSGCIQRFFHIRDNRFIRCLLFYREFQSFFILRLFAFAQ